MQETGRLVRRGVASLVAFSHSSAARLTLLAQQLGNLRALAMNRLKLRQCEKRPAHEARGGLAQCWMRVCVVDHRQQAAVDMAQGRRGFGQPAGTCLRIGEIEMAHQGRCQGVIGSWPTVEMRQHEHPRRLANSERPQRFAAVEQVNTLLSEFLPNLHRSGMGVGSAARRIHWIT